MKTLQEQYNLIKEGKGSKHVFLTEAKRQFPNMLTNSMPFEDATEILTKRGVISENYVDLQPINTIESKKENWEDKFKNFISEDLTKAKVPAMDVDAKAAQDRRFDYADKTNLDNQIGQEVFNGIYFEAKQNPDKNLDQLKEIVSKNLAKDPQYYMKNAAFGIKGLGYQETEVQEVSGKFKSSGYSDKLKTLVKEVLTEGTKKTSIDSTLGEIDKQANIVALEAKLQKLDEIIQEKLDRISMISEDENLAELVDKKQVKKMQKEIKLLEKKKVKMEKLYEKACGKKYTKEVIDEDQIELEESKKKLDEYSTLNYGTEYDNPYDDYYADKAEMARAEELYDKGLELFQQGNLEGAEKLRNKAIEISGLDNEDFPPYEDFPSDILDL